MHTTVDPSIVRSAQFRQWAIRNKDWAIADGIVDQLTSAQHAHWIHLGLIGNLHHKYRLRIIQRFIGDDNRVKLRFGRSGKILAPQPPVQAPGIELKLGDVEALMLFLAAPQIGAASLFRDELGATV